MDDKKQVILSDEQFSQLVTKANQGEAQKTLDLIMGQQKMDIIQAVLELLNEENINMITEHPTTNYTKMVTKFETLRQHQAMNSGYAINNFHTRKDFATDQDKVIKPMLFQWKLTMTAHKGGLRKLIVQALRNDNLVTLQPEPSKRKRFLGLI